MLRSAVIGKCWLVGASVIDHIAIAEQLSRLRFPAGIRVPPETFKNLPRDKRLVIAAGTQGEARSALTRISRGEHPDYRVESGDLLIHSARMIPGNTEAIEQTLDRFRRLGVEVVTRRDDTIHVSGHPCHDDVQAVFNWVRPTNFLPVHGNYGQLRAAQAIAEGMGLTGTRTGLAEDGDYVSLGEHGLDVRPGIGRCVRYVDEKGERSGVSRSFIVAGWQGQASSLPPYLSMGPTTPACRSNGVVLRASRSLHA